MRGVLKTILAAGIAGSSLFITVSANADNWDKWEKWEHRHRHWKQDYVVERQVVIERPVVIARPAPVYPAPVYMAPAMPAYGYGGYPPQDPSVNFNFSFPMR